MKNKTNGQSSGGGLNQEIIEQYKQITTLIREVDNEYYNAEQDRTPKEYQEYTKTVIELNKAMYELYCKEKQYKYVYKIDDIDNNNNNNIKFVLVSLLNTLTKQYKSKEEYLKDKQTRENVTLVIETGYLDSFMYILTDDKINSTIINNFFEPPPIEVVDPQTEYVIDYKARNPIVSKYLGKFLNGDLVREYGRHTNYKTYECGSEYGLNLYNIRNYDPETDYNLKKEAIKCITDSIELTPSSSKDSIELTPSRSKGSIELSSSDSDHTLNDHTLSAGKPRKVNHTKRKIRRKTRKLRYTKRKVHRKIQSRRKNPCNTSLDNVDNHRVSY